MFSARNFTFAFRLPIYVCGITMKAAWTFGFQRQQFPKTCGVVRDYFPFTRLSLGCSP